VDLPYRCFTPWDRLSVRLLTILLIAACLVTAACGATKQARTVERLGFLKDLYPKMSEGNESAGESLLIYKNPRIASIPPNTYTKFMLDLAAPSTAHGRYLLCADLPGSFQGL
jgi:hypothetical protein